ncbi:MAG: hypothetical protein ACYSSI_00835 [Planctomycetota bacterium]
MKKTFLMLTVLVLAVPAMAAVSIDVNDLGDGWVAIEYTADSNVSAFGLRVSVDSGETIDDINSNYHIGESNSTAKGYGIFLGKIVIDGGGNVTSYGDPIAPNSDPGASGTGLGTSTVVLELGALYEDGNQPPLSGTLCTLKVSGCCAMSVVGDSTRCGIADGNDAGAVLENSTSVEVDVSGATGVSIDYSCGCACFGDLNGDGWVMLPDMYQMIALFNTKGPPYQIPNTDPLYNLCADMNADDWMMLPDLYQLIALFNSVGPPYQIQCPY